jgi:hypothetical protein
MLLITIYPLIDWLSLLVKLQDLVFRPATSILPCNTWDFEILPVRYLIVTVQHQDPQYDPVPWPAARISGRSPSYQLMEGRCHVTDATAGWEPSQPASCYLFVSLSTSRHIA